MASDQSMTQAITQAAIEATKVAIMAVREVEGPIESRPVHVVPRKRWPALRQPTFDWKAQNKYKHLNNFKIEVRNIFMVRSYNKEESKTVPIIMDWLGHEGLRFIQMLPMGKKSVRQAQGCLRC